MNARAGRVNRAAALLLAALAGWFAHAGGQEPGVPAWTETTAGGDRVVGLWYFWSANCPHCRDSRPRVERLAAEAPWLRFRSLPLDGRPDNLALYRQLAERVGAEARSVPAFLFCGRMLVGWDNGGETERLLREELERCRDGQGNPSTATGVLALPVLGEIDPAGWSLPLFTLVVAGLDSFNPCAFFVLLFLLSLLAHARSRSRMLLIGGLFILVSAAVYFLALAAWLNLFVLFGYLPFVTLGAGLLAIAIGAINVKEFFWFKRGVSLTLSDRQRGRLGVRIRGLLSQGSVMAMAAATLSLAVVANLYELLCTAGFPMVYTRVLTLRELPPAGHYAYLLLYAAVYVVPLLLILGFFVFTLGGRRLREGEGRVLKLVSGLMMLGLGALLVAAPGALASPWVAAALLAASVLSATLLARWAPSP